MVLCSICRGISFDDPHPVPSEYVLPGLPDPDDPNNELYCIQLKEGYSPPMMFGYTHYQSLQELKSSAQDDDCGLCTLIYDEFHRIWKTLTKRRSSWRFFITKREHSQKGFQVWTDGDYGMRRVGAFGYVIKHPDTDPLAKIYPGRLIVPDSSSSASWNIAQGWIDHCEKHHSSCGPGKADVLLPRRVIHVGRNNNELKIVETSNDYGSYVILSYSWGSTDKKGNTLKFPYRLQQTNLSNYKVNIPASALGKAQSILDAITITRKLGIKYLWIDALCIEQRLDSDPPFYQTKDWHREAPKMSQYYSNAYLTLSSAWSVNSEDGVYNNRPALNSYTWIHHNLNEDAKGKLTIVPLSLEKENIMPSYVTMANENITTRGWTLQERILSPRTLFYGTDQMYWECNERFLSENGFHATGRMFSADKHARQISIWEDGTKQEPRDLWAMLIEAFSKRNLGNSNDKLVAVSGLADKFSKIFKDTYLAGLWKKTAIEDLFWETDGPFKKWSDTKNWSPRAKDYRAPSWSWAAFDFDPKVNTEGAVHPPDEKIFAAKKLAVHIDSGTTPVGSPNGAVTAAYLLLNAAVLHLHVDTDRTHVHRGEYAFTYKKREIQYKTELDFHFQSVTEVSALNIHAVILARDAITDPSNPIYLSLLVTPVGNDYRRIGILWIDEKILGSHAPDFNGDWWSINLV